ncbi:MAG: glycoside hydrolase family 3 C-terminal domain-containing protein, partial [Victivallales bacterium]|nr:glycoside hydrolase family 3 C-terminal domain-containing protein [Victivallales bacterium]
SLREVYLTAFEIAVKESRPWMMMSSYNKINGTFASACKLTQQDIAKDEWGFDGVMVSDWGGAHDTYGCAMGGLDLEMGQGVDSIMGQPLLKLVQNGLVPETVIDDKARRMLRLFFRLGLMDQTTPAGEINTSRHQQSARRFAAAGMVLLKNTDHALPLQPQKLKTLAVIGPNADYHHAIGPLEACGGSGAVHAPYEITPLAGLRRYGEEHGIEIFYTPGEVFSCNAIIPAQLLTHGGEPGLDAAYYRDEAAMERGDAPFRRTVDRHLELNWNKVHAVADNREELPDRDFTVRWNGELTPEHSGKAQLSLYCLRGRARVLLDGAEVMASNPDQSCSRAEYHLVATAGQSRKVEIIFTATAPEPEFKLLWQSAAAADWDEAKKIAAAADWVVFCGGTNHFYDREALGWGDIPGADIPDLELPGRQAELIAALARVNPRIIVVLTNGSVVAVESWLDRVPVLLETWYPGQEGGNALADVLFGAAEPGGRLCCTWGKQLTDYACHANGNYPGVRTGAHPHVNYDEGMFIGYRHFDRAGITPRFPFGFGLGYSEFALEPAGMEIVAAEADAPEIKVSVAITNTGKRAGTEVIQVYVGDDEASVERPVRELKAFRQVHLEPGGAATVTFPLTRRDFAWWSPSTRNWEVEPGEFTIAVGTSATDIVYAEKVILRPTRRQ